MDQYTPSSSTRKIGESLFSGLVVGAGVAAERYFNQDASIGIITDAGLRQTVLTFNMAMICMSLYDTGVQKLPTSISMRRRKVITGTGIGVLSGLFNRAVQYDTQGTIEEAVVMTSLSIGAITAYEYKILLRIKENIQKNIYNILDISIQTGQILGLR